jgi:subtilisin family serine protease
MAISSFSVVFAEEEYTLEERLAYTGYAQEDVSLTVDGSEAAPVNPNIPAFGTGQGSLNANENIIYRTTDFVPYTPEAEYVIAWAEEFVDVQGYVQGLDGFADSDTVTVMVWLQQLPLAMKEIYDAQRLFVPGLQAAEAQANDARDIINAMANGNGRDSRGVTAPITLIAEYFGVFAGFALTTTVATALQIAEIPGVHAVTLEAIFEREVVEMYVDFGRDHAYTLDPDHEIPGNAKARDITGVTALHNEGIIGTGVKIAIIDDGIMMNHPDLNNAISGYNFGGKTANLHTGLNTHGTHVAGTAASTGQVNSLGVAPGATLYNAMVFDVGSTGAAQSDTAAALEVFSGFPVPNMPAFPGLAALVADGTLGKVDVINMSMGVSNNFTCYGLGQFERNNAVLRGVFIANSAGNNANNSAFTVGRRNYSMGSGSTALSMSVAATDFGGQDFSGYPGAKVNGQALQSFIINNGDEGTEAAAPYWREDRFGVTETHTVTFTGVDWLPPAAQGVEYTRNPLVWHEGLGYEIYWAAPVNGDMTQAQLDALALLPVNSLSGKILVVNRGLAFQQYLWQALRTGAGALLILNRDGTDVNMDIRNIPSKDMPLLWSYGVGRSAVWAAYEAADGAPLYINPETMGSVPMRNQPALFSSIGPTLETGIIKPEITAPGNRILSTTVAGTSANPQASWGLMGGTSMSSPFIAGVAALVIQHLQDEGIPYTPADIKARIMAGADPFAIVPFDGQLVNAPNTYFNPAGTQSSVWEQGAGFVNAYRAVHDNVMFTVTHDAPTGQTSRAELSHQFSAISFRDVPRNGTAMMPVTVHGLNNFTVSVMYNENTRYSAANLADPERQVEVTAVRDGNTINVYLLVREDAIGTRAAGNLYEGYIKVDETGGQGRTFYVPWAVRVSGMVTAPCPSFPNPCPGFPICPVCPDPSKALVILDYDFDRWGDGSGYQLWMEDAAGTIIPGVRTLNDVQWLLAQDQFLDTMTHWLPTDATTGIDGNAVLPFTSASMSIEPGSFHYIVTNPDGDFVWIAGAGGPAPNPGLNMQFRAGYRYTFGIVAVGQNDGVTLTGVPFRDQFIDDIVVDIRKPSGGRPPATSASGYGFGAAITWTPNVDVFAWETNYTAHVTLSANNMYFFEDGASISVPGAISVSNIVYGDKEVKFDALFNTGVQPGNATVGVVNRTTNTWSKSLALDSSMQAIDIWQSGGTINYYGTFDVHVPCMEGRNPEDGTVPLAELFVNTAESYDVPAGSYDAFLWSFGTGTVIQWFAPFDFEEGKAYIINLNTLFTGTPHGRGLWTVTEFTAPTLDASRANRDNIHMYGGEWIISAEGWFPDGLAYELILEGDVVETGFMTGTTTVNRLDNESVFTKVHTVNIPVNETGEDQTYTFRFVDFDGEFELLVDGTHPGWTSIIAVNGVTTGTHATRRSILLFDSRLTAWSLPSVGVTNGAFDAHIPNVPMPFLGPVNVNNHAFGAQGEGVIRAGLNLAAWTSWTSLATGQVWNWVNNYNEIEFQPGTIYEMRLTNWGNTTGTPPQLGATVTTTVIPERFDGVVSSPNFMQNNGGVWDIAINGRFAYGNDIPWELYIDGELADEGLLVNGITRRQMSFAIPHNMTGGDVVYEFRMPGFAGNPNYAVQTLTQEGAPPTGVALVTLNVGTPWGMLDNSGYFMALGRGTTHGNGWGFYEFFIPENAPTRTGMMPENFTGSVLVPAGTYIIHTSNWWQAAVSWTSDQRRWSNVVLNEGDQFDVTINTVGGHVVKHEPGPNIEVIPTTGGSVTGGGVVLPGFVAVLNAFPSPGYHFGGWFNELIIPHNDFSTEMNDPADFGSLISMDNPYTFIVEEPMVINALFEPSFTLTTETKVAAPGDEVVLEISIEDNFGLQSINLDLVWDTDLLTLVTPTGPDHFDGDIYKVIVWTTDLSVPFGMTIESPGMVDVYSDGVIARLTFTVNSNAPDNTFAAVTATVAEGTYAATVEIIDLLGGMLQGGVLIIEEPEGCIFPGDVNHDGRIDLLDVLLVRRYIAGWYETGELPLCLHCANINPDGSNRIDNAVVMMLRHHIVRNINIHEGVDPGFLMASAEMFGADRDVFSAAPPAANDWVNMRDSLGHLPTVEGDIYVNVGSVSARAGEYVEVNVKIDENPGVAALRFGVVYDTNALELVGFTTAGALPLPVAPLANAVTPYFGFESNSLMFNNTVTGNLTTLTFRINESAEAGASFPIELVDIRALDVGIRDINVIASGATVSVLGFEEPPVDEPPVEEPPVEEPPVEEPPVDEPIEEEPIEEEPPVDEPIEEEPIEEEPIEEEPIEEEPIEEDEDDEEFNPIFGDDEVIIDLPIEDGGGRGRP